MIKDNTQQQKQPRRVRNAFFFLVSKDQCAECSRENLRAAVTRNLLDVWRFRWYALGMDPFDMMCAKYRAMEKAATAQAARLVHDAANVSMQIVASEMGLVKMIKRFFPSKN
jgi:hypothetical protein